MSEDSEDSICIATGKPTTAEKTLAGVRKDVDKTIKKHSSMQAMRTAAKAVIRHRNPPSVGQKAKIFNLDKR